MNLSVPLRLFLFSFLLTFLSSFPVISSSSSSSSSSSFPRVPLSSGLVNSELKRVIDIRTHVELVTIQAKIQNDDPAPISTYLVAIPPSKLPHLSYVEGLLPRSSGSKGAEEKLYATRVEIDQESGKGSEGKAPEGTAFFQLELKTAVKPGASASFTIVQAYTRTLKPFPESIPQEANQLVLYHDSVYIFSAYPTQKQSTSVKLQSGEIESYTKKSSNRAGDGIEYGPYESISPFSHHDLSVHYQNNAPFVTVTRLQKDIEVSHWGNVAIEETYFVQHTGAKISGSYQRDDMQRGRFQAPSSWRLLSGSVSKYATDFYVRDVIGNVSTSRVRRERSQTVIEVEPRYPMFGGWTADFQVGYNLPAHHYLFTSASDSSLYVLNITFGSMFPVASIDEAEVRVILPEGASDIIWSTPFDVDAESYDFHVTHLDTSGRPVLLLRKSNCVKHHDQFFQVAYRFRFVSLLHEPFLLISAFFLVFFVAMISYRVELGFETKIVQNPTPKRSSVNPGSSSSSNGIGSLVSRHTGSTGGLNNKIIKGISELIRHYEKRDEDNVKKSELLLNEIRNQLTELGQSTEVSGDVTSKVEAALVKLRTEARKLAKAEQKEVPEVKKGFTAAQQELQNLLVQL